MATHKTGLEILPIIKTPTVDGAILAFIVVLLTGIALFKEIDTLATAYIVIASLVVLGVHLVERCFWLRRFEQNVSYWEIAFFEGHWSLKPLDARTPFWWTRYGSQVLEIKAYGRRDLSEPEVTYVTGEQSRVVTDASQICDGHIVGLLEAAQYDLHGQNRILLGPAGTYGRVQYTINDEGIVHVATIQLIGVRECVHTHGELHAILNLAGDHHRSSRAEA